MQTPEDAHPDDVRVRLIRRHFRAGWWFLLLFVLLGFALELLHAMKAGLYLNVSNETRRLMWTLAHAHGTLLALVQLAFAATVACLPAWTSGTRSGASACLLGAGMLIPLGFFLGGVAIYGGDPGLGIALVPPGAVLLVVGAFLTARGAASAGHQHPPTTPVIADVPPRSSQK